MKSNLELLSTYFIGSLWIICSCAEATELARKQQTITPQKGQLLIHVKEDFGIQNISKHRGQNNPRAITQDIKAIEQDISKIPYEDFDVTEKMQNSLSAKAVGTESSIRRIKSFYQSLGLDKSIPCVDGNNPIPDYVSMYCIVPFTVDMLGKKLHPSKVGTNDFLTEILAVNNSNLDSKLRKIPDIDCLYYKQVRGKQHLFLRLSSQTRQEAELFFRRSEGKNLFVEGSGNIIVSAGNRILLDHASIDSSANVFLSSKFLLNRASTLKAKWMLRLKADEQQHYTVINKWTRVDSGAHHYTHAEGIESIDEGAFIAQQVVQEGGRAENYGIAIHADEFLDLCDHNKNMPAKITLYNYAWAEKDGLFSHSESSVTRHDDVLVPTRYDVKFFRSISDKPGASIECGYTVVASGSKIEIYKGVKKDIPVKEQHTLEMHEERSGFLLFGGVSVPDPTAQLRKVQQAYKANNMPQLTMSGISAVAEGIRFLEDCNTINKLATQKSDWTNTDTSALFNVLGRFVNAGAFIGTNSADLKQSTTYTHGNTFIGPEQTYSCKNSASFAGEYRGKNIKIETPTLVTFALPQEEKLKTSVHQAGVSLDLFSFATALMTSEVSAAISSGLSASAFTVNFRNSKEGQVSYHPTVIQASDRIDIKADNGELEQAQIKAGIVHAIFSNDLVLKTLANKKWSKRSGGSAKVGLGALGFEDLANDLRSSLKSTEISKIDAISFEKKIDDFASMVGEKEFYLEVGGVLRSESAFLGHKNHNPKHEHIKAKQISIKHVEESRVKQNFDFGVNIGDVTEVFAKILDSRPLDYKKNDSDYVSKENTRQQTLEEKQEVSKTAEAINQKGIQTERKIKAEIGNEEFRKLSEGEEVSEASRGKILKILAGSQKELQSQKDAMNARYAFLYGEVREQSQKIQNQLFDEKIRQYKQLSEKLHRSIPLKEDSKVAVSPIAPTIPALTVDLAKECSIFSKYSRQNNLLVHAPLTLNSPVSEPSLASVLVQQNLESQQALQPKPQLLSYLGSKVASNEPKSDHTASATSAVSSASKNRIDSIDVGGGNRVVFEELQPKIVSSSHQLLATEVKVQQIEQQKQLVVTELMNQKPERLLEAQERAVKNSEKAKAELYASGFFGLYEGQDKLKAPSLTIGEKDKVRLEVAESTERAFNREKDIIEACFNGQIKFERGEGYINRAEFEQSLKSYDSGSGYGASCLAKEEVDRLFTKANQPEERMYRLVQGELYKIGESDSQKVTKDWVPFAEVAMDRYFGRISNSEFCSRVTQEVALSLAGGAVVNKAVKSAGRVIKAVAGKVAKKESGGGKVLIHAQPKVVEKGFPQSERSASKNILKIEANKSIANNPETAVKQAKTPPRVEKASIAYSKGDKIACKSKTVSNVATKAIQKQPEVSGAAQKDAQPKAVKSVPAPKALIAPKKDLETTKRIAKNSSQEAVQKKIESKVAKEGNSVNFGTVDNYNEVRLTKSEAEILKKTTEKISTETDPQKIKQLASKFQRDYSNNVNTALKHRTELAFKEAGVLNEDGTLAQKAIRESKKIDLGADGLKNPELEDVLCSEGSGMKLSDWSKYETKSVKLSTGERRKIHFYKNEKTGKIDYKSLDYKVSTPVSIGSKLK